MRIKLLIAFLLIGFIGNSQIRYLHPWYHFENKVTINDLYVDSVFYAPLIDTGTYTPSRVGAITIHNTGAAYIWNGTAWVILAGAADGNNYPSALTFSGGILTVPRNGLSDLTATIDGRYLKISDTLGIWLTETTANNLYASSTHSHVATDISDLTSYVRNLFSGGTGITYNDSTGVISWNGSASGITSLNGLTGTTQTFTEGYGFDISSAGTAHTFDLDSAIWQTRLRGLHLFDSLNAIVNDSLSDHWAAIEALQAGGVGTPTLQQVLDAGNTTTTDIYLGNDVVLYKNGNRFLHTYKASGAEGRNIFLGENAGNFTMTSSGSTSSRIVAIGDLAGSSNTIGFDAVYVGIEAGRFNTEGVDNTFIGNYAGLNNLTGSSNTFLGYGSGIDNESGAHNTFVGYGSGEDALDSNNTAVGMWSGRYLTTGKYNTLIGTGTGIGLTTGSNNTLIGARINATGLSNNIILADGEGNKRLQFDNNGKGTMAAYGSGTHTGTGAYSLQVDASGNIIEGAIGGGSGETNTASNLGGGLANYDSKSVADLRFNSFNATDFDLASNLISIDATLKSTWNGKIDPTDTADMLGFYYRDVDVVQDSLLVFTKGNGSKDTVEFTPGGSSGGGGGGSYTDADARAAISLTTTGTSGAATYDDGTGVLNVPDYSAGMSITQYWFYDELTIGGVTSIIDRAEIWDKMISTRDAASGTSFLAEFVAGSGADASIGNTGSTPDDAGWATMTTGTTTTGKATLFPVSATQAKMNVDTTKIYRYEAKVRLEDLSDGTDTYTFLFGNTNYTNIAQNRITFTYTHDVNSGNWTTNSMDGASLEQQDTGVPVVPDTDYILAYEFDGERVRFYIDGSLVTTHVTELPAHTSGIVPGLLAILKTAGTNARIAYIDYYKYRRL